MAIVSLKLDKDAAGNVRAHPARALTPELRDFIRASKEALLEGVQHLVFCADQPPAVAMPDAHRTWLIRFPDRPSLQVLFVPDATREQAMAGYPGAVSAEPYQPTDQAPDAAMLEQERAAVRSWLHGIGETDPGTISEVLARCEQDRGARAYFLGRARTCYEYEERAAIIEYDAGQPREAGEQQAREQVCTGCAHFASPGRSDGYCGAPARRNDLAPAYGEGHPLRKLPDDLGASCPAWSDGAVTQ